MHCLAPGTNFLAPATVIRLVSTLQRQPELSACKMLKTICYDGVRESLGSKTKMHIPSKLKKKKKEGKIYSVLTPKETLKLFRSVGDKNKFLDSHAIFSDLLESQTVRYPCTYL